MVTIKIYTSYDYLGELICGEFEPKMWGVLV